jgi:pyruvate dehydrogenase E2 component (dihydrolipoamide acetyltransferase)
MLGLTMEEGTVAEWLKQEGESVKKDEPLLTVEMDKGTVEVPSPAAGILRRIVVQPGTTVPVKALIAEIAAPGEAWSAPAVAGDEATANVANAAVATATVAATTSGASSERVVGTTTPPVVDATVARTTGGGQRVFASPRARMRARALDVDLTTLHGSGPHGRIVEADVLATSDGDTAARVLITPLARRLAQEHGIAVEELQGTGPGGRITQDDVQRAAEQRTPGAAADRRTAGADLMTPGADQGTPGADQRTPGADQSTPGAAPFQPNVVPLSRIRRITAERMAVSAQATARVTLFLDADFSEAARFRTQLQPEFARLGVPKLPWDALIAKAAALALAEHHTLVAQWVEGQGLRPADTVHVGVAVALEPEGLVVPVLRDVGRRSLRELAGELVGLVDKARAGRLSPGEMQGGTFTITNLGAYRIDGFTPIINPPETAILGVGRIADKPVVVDGKVGVATLCTLSLSFDHRVVDGATAAAFLARLAELLERPYALLGI